MEQSSYQYKQPFKLEYIHNYELARSKMCTGIPGVFKITLADIVLGMPGCDYQTPGDDFNAFSFLDCILDLFNNKNSGFNLDIEGSFVIGFNIICKNDVEVYVNPATLESRLPVNFSSIPRIRIPKKHAIKELLDCYNSVVSH